MEHPDENDLPDSAIKAMWDEGEPVELAAGTMSDQLWDSISLHKTSTRVQATHDTHTGAFMFRTDDPVYFEADLPPGGYDQIVTSDAPLRIRIWQTDRGTVRFRIGRWGEMPDAKLRET